MYLRKNRKKAAEEKPLQELETDYTDRCGNCYEKLPLEDKYCRLCGTKRDEGKFQPYKNLMYAAYGPMIGRKYRCPSCDFTWTSSVFGRKHEQFCPNCGEAIVTMVDETITPRYDFAKDLFDDLKNESE